MAGVRSRRITMMVGSSFVGGLLLGSAVVLPSQSRSPAKTATASAPRPAAEANVNSLAALSEAFASVAARVRPSVVYIESQSQARRSITRVPPRVPPEFEPFFRQQPNQNAPRRGSGSGFIISEDGEIITNAHVVDGADRVKVRLLDQREYTAKVLGSDPSTDVAVIKIEADRLTPAPLGNSDEARIGEWVLAVGNPLGENLSFTVTSGIVSAKGRSLALPNRTERSIQDFIQTDAAINRGNSGGPLVNVRGEVIGVNSAIASETGFYAGYGFAIPINLARQVADQLIRSGQVDRVALGIRVRDATENDAAYVGLDRVYGVVVQDVGGAESGAARAGLRLGDVIVAIDGKPAEYVGQLQQAIAFRKPGETVAVEVARKGGARATIRVPLQRVGRSETLARNDDEDAPRSDRRTGRSVTVEKLGLTIANLSGAEAAELGLPEGTQGVAITDVDQSGPAAERLVDPQGGTPEVLVALEGRPIRSVSDVEAQLQALRPGTVVELRLYNPEAKLTRVERIRVTD